MTYRAAITLSLGACLALAAASPALAQGASSEERARAEELFEEATGLVAKRDFANACRKLEEVIRLQPQGIGAQMSLADCYVGEGRLASAHAALGRASELAINANQQDRAKLARDRQDSLAPRLSKISIVVPKELMDLEGLRVLRNGVAIASANLNVPTPVDRGAYGIVATAPGRKRFEKTFMVGDEGTLLTAMVTLPPETPSAAPPIPVSTPPAEAEEASPWSGLRVAGVVTGIVGLGLAAAGAGLGVDGVSRMEVAVEAYDDGERNGDDIEKSSALEVYEAGEKEATAGWVLVGVGAAVAGTGLIMSIVAPNAGATTQKAAFTPWISRDQWSVGVVGRW